MIISPSGKITKIAIIPHIINVKTGVKIFDNISGTIFRTFFSTNAIKNPTNSALRSPPAPT